MEDQLAAANTIVSEVYYYLSVPLMVLIHAGFLAYEMGASRMKNVLASGIKNILAFAFMVPTFYFFGWFTYWAFPNGLIPSPENLETAIAYANPFGEVMGPHFGDHATGVFWAAFTMFAATTASIFSGAVIERIRESAFLILAIVLGSFAWVVGAAWGWHGGGWLVTQWGYHDFGAAGVVHMVAGFFALGVLINLGPRWGKFNSDGSANDIPGHNMPLTLIGLMLIIVGFFGFLMACLLYPSVYTTDGAWAAIYGTPMTLSALGFNILMGFAGGIIGAWMFTRDPFWMMSGGLAGIIACASGLDVWWPPMAFAIAFIGGAILKPSAKFFESLGIDDAVGAVTVHGVVGLWGVLAVGIFATGYPGLQGEGAVATSFIGQLIGAGAMFACGFVPGYFISLIMKWMGILRVPHDVEIAGLDPTKVPAMAYPEGIPVSPAPHGH